MSYSYTIDIIIPCVDKFCFLPGKENVRKILLRKKLQHTIIMLYLLFDGNKKKILD